MILNTTKEELFLYIKKQLIFFLPDKTRFESPDVYIAFELALTRTENCFRHIILPGFTNNEGESCLSTFHSDQYAMFLYYFMNSLWKKSHDDRLCSKIMYLNRILHGFFVSYKCELPDIFCFQHPVGSVIGNANYSDYLVILQNVTVNTGVSKDGSLCPSLGKGLMLCAGAKIIGNEPIGNRCSIGVNAVVYNQKVPDDSNVISTGGGYFIVPRKKDFCLAQKYFSDKI